MTTAPAEDDATTLDAAGDASAAASDRAPSTGGIIDERIAARVVEALLFASDAPLGEDVLAERLPEGADIRAILDRLAEDYAGRGVNLVRVAGKWQFRTADDLAFLLHREAVEQRKLSRATLETLAIIAYHQPVTRAEIEAIRGVTMSKGTLDVLLAAGFIRMRGRRRTPGRPVTYGTTEGFLVHFGLEAIQDLPGLEELKGAGLLDGQIPAGFHVPIPSDQAGLTDDEEPLEETDLVALMESERDGETGSEMPDEGQDDEEQDR
jgi:segregation and condensation protein B